MYKKSLNILVIDYTAKKGAVGSVASHAHQPWSDRMYDKCMCGRAQAVRIFVRERARLVKDAVGAG